MDTDSMDTGSVLSTVEQRTHNPLVRGSNPCGPTVIKPRFTTGFCV